MNRPHVPLRFILILGFLSITSAVQGLDLTVSGDQLILHADSESGSFYIENDNPVNAGLRYLLFKDSPPTSYITLILNGKPYRLNDSVLKTVSVLSEKNDHIQGQYSLGLVNFEVNFKMTNINTSNEAVLLYVSVNNLSNQSVTVGTRFFYDTYYNERWGDPKIYLSSSEQVEYERLILEESTPRFIFNGVYKDNNYNEGLFLYPYINDFIPSSIIIGNWKKLDENELSYDVVPSAQFKYTDYSSKDAAIAVFFKDITVNPGETVSFGNLLLVSKVDFKTSNGNRYLLDLVDSVDDEDVESETIEVAEEVIEPETDPVESPAVIEPVVTNTVKAVVTNKVYVTETNFVAKDMDTNNLTYDQTLRLNELQLLEMQLEAMERLTTMIEKMDATLGTGLFSDSTNATGKALYTVDEKDEEIEELKETYEQKIKAQKTEYETKLVEQQEEFYTMMDELESELSTGLTKVRRFETMDEIDDTLNVLDQYIVMIEQLEKLKLDFESMPKSQLEALNKKIDDLESQLKKLDNN